MSEILIADYVNPNQDKYEIIGTMIISISIFLLGYFYGDVSSLITEWSWKDLGYTILNLGIFTGVLFVLFILYRKYSSPKTMSDEVSISIDDPSKDTGNDKNSLAVLTTDMVKTAVGGATIDDGSREEARRKEIVAVLREDEKARLEKKRSEKSPKAKSTEKVEEAEEMKKAKKVAAVESKRKEMVAVLRTDEKARLEKEKSVRDTKDEAKATEAAVRAAKSAAVAEEAAAVRAAVKKTETAMAKAVVATFSSI